MEETVNPDFESNYFPLDINAMVRDWKSGGIVGESSRIAELDQVFKWKKGMQNSFYGWSNDGKSTYFDFQAVIKSKIDDWKWCFMKQEDMTNTIAEKKVKKSAQNIHNNLIWTLTGKCVDPLIAKRMGIPQIEKKELLEAADWVDEHFFIIAPKDRRWEAVLDYFRFMHQKYNFDGLLIDPFKSLIIPETSRTDKMMDEIFIAAKEFALETNTVFNWIAHPKSLQDVKVGKDPQSAFKVVNQFMISGGAAWDNNMDGQYSIYRPERHLNPSDPKVHFWNLKQRHAELVGCKRGVYENIKFDETTRRYYFNTICPLDGTRLVPAFQKKQVNIFDQQTQSPPPPSANTDDLPF